MHGNAFFATDKAKLFGGGSFDANLVHTDSKGPGQISSMDFIYPANLGL